MAICGRGDHLLSGGKDKKILFFVDGNIHKPPVKTLVVNHIPRGLDEH